MRILTSIAYLSIFSFTFVKLIDSKLQMRIMKTSIFNFAPCLKLHHLVLLTNGNDLYTIDFTPIDQEKPDTLLKLLTGQNVPAEIRLRCFEKTNINDDKKVMTIWDAPFTNEESIKLTNKIYSNIKDNEIKSFIEKLFYWKHKNKLSEKNSNREEMNLYVCNCQHFSKFAEKCVDVDN